MVRKSTKKSHPRMLSSVLKAIAELKDVRGSSTKKIVDRISLNTTDKRGRKQRNITMQVRKALQHGVQNGLLCQRAGKYKIGDGVVDKNFDSQSVPVTEARRRKKGGKGKGRKRKGKGGGGKRRRRRRSSISVSEGGEDSSVTESMTTYSEFSDDSEKKGRKRTRRATKGDDSKSKKKAKKSDQDKDMDAYENDIANVPECDNPDCLCNIKKEKEEVTETRASDDDVNQDYPGGSYIN